MKAKLFLFFLLTNSLLLSAQNISSIHFDGIDDYIYIGNDIVFDITQQITIEAWVKYDSLQYNDATRIIDKLDNKQRRGYMFGLSGGYLFMKLYAPNGDLYYLSGNKSIRDNRWHHVAGTYDGKKQILFIDGKIDRSDIISGPNLLISKITYPLCIGSNHMDTTGFPIHGGIDEVRIWRIARDSSLLRKYKDSCLQGNESGLIGYWRFNENRDTITNDKTGNKNNGMLKNGAAWSSDLGFKELCTTSSIGNFLEKKTVSIFPNPLTESSILALGKLTLPSTITIYNSFGKLIKIYYTTSGHINLSSLDFKKGMYFVNIAYNSGQNFINIKFMVK